MARVKRSVHSKKHRRQTLEHAKGYYGNKSRSFRATNEQVMHSGQYTYHDRRARKGNYRQLWIQRMNAACRLHGISYSRFISGLRLAEVEVDRKVLADPRGHRRRHVRAAGSHHEGGQRRRGRRRLSPSRLSPGRARGTATSACDARPVALRSAPPPEGRAPPRPVPRRPCPTGPWAVRRRRSRARRRGAGRRGGDPRRLLGRRPGAGTLIDRVVRTGAGRHEVAGDTLTRATDPATPGRRRRSRSATLPTADPTALPRRPGRGPRRRRRTGQRRHDGTAGAGGRGGDRRPGGQRERRPDRSQGRACVGGEPLARVPVRGRRPRRPARRAARGRHGAGRRPRPRGGARHGRPDPPSGARARERGPRHLGRGGRHAVGGWVQIPTVGVESLNVAMAATVALFECARQRRNGFPRSARLGKVRSDDR